MNATLTSKNTVDNYNFNITLNDVTYQVSVFLNEKGKFIDVEINLKGESVSDDNDIYQAIVEYLDNNWDTLTK